MYNVALPEINWPLLGPIVMVIVAGLIGLIIEMFNPKRTNNAIVVTSLVGLVGSAILLVQNLSIAPQETFARMLLHDNIGSMLQLAIVAATFLTVLFSEGYLREKRVPFAEFYPLLLWASAGAMIMVSTSSLLMVFIGLEVLSIALYVMAGLCRDEERSEESAIKYFLLGAFATGFFLYGISFVYGATGGVHLGGIQAAWAQGDVTTKNLLIFGVSLMLIGLAFKTALFPFHQWTPDVYQGAPTNVTAFMAAVSKIAAVGALFRVLDAGAGMKSLWLPILTVLAILTMLGGNIIATAQKDVKRILGYSSIANAGYILCAILAHIKSPDKVTSQSLIFFLYNYAIMTIGAFAVISLLARAGKEGTRLNDLNGMWQKAPFVTVTFVIFVASLIGIPPTGGFFAKLYVFNDLLTADLVPLAIVLAVSSAISAYYYLAMIFAAMVSEESETGMAKATPSLALKTTCALCAAGVFAMAIFTSPILTAMGGVQ